MLVAFQDELGVVVVNVSKPIIFGVNKVYFTDDNDRDYTVNIEHLINIAMAEWKRGNENVQFNNKTI